jgi:hypothetical protein
MTKSKNKLKSYTVQWEMEMVDAKKPIDSSQRCTQINV